MATTGGIVTICGSMTFFDQMLQLTQGWGGQESHFPAL